MPRATSVSVRLVPDRSVHFRTMSRPSTTLTCLHLRKLMNAARYTRSQQHLRPPVRLKRFALRINRPDRSLQACGRVCSSV